jgi:protein-histidine N-methyltransferase
LNLESKEKKKITLARRELFDVRAQLMAEDDDDDSELIAGLEQGDLKPNFYEGGFKTWECSLDLADLLLSEESNTDDGLHLVELGCGTAVPSLALFARLFSLPSSPSQEGGRFRFTLADYNSTVLRLVTLSNFLLTWWVNSPASPRQQNPNSERNTSLEEVEGELDIDPTLLDAFQADLSSRGITLDFISGGWSAEFVQLVLDPSITSTSTLILASETIYAPSSLNVFSETLLELLRRSGHTNESRATALIAAKKVYFGVGGGVDEFLQVLYKQPLRDGEASVDVQERKEINSGGVKRVVLEVQIR